MSKSVRSAGEVLLIILTLAWGGWLVATAGHCPLPGAGWTGDRLLMTNTVLCLAGTAVAGVLLLVAGAALLAARGWGRSLLIGAAGLQMLALMARFAMFGPYQEEMTYLLGFAAPVILMLLAGLRAVRERYPSRGAVGTTLRIYGVIAALQVLMGGALWFMFAHPGGGTVLAAHDYLPDTAPPLPAAAVPGPYPLPFTVPVPPGFTLRDVRLTGTGSCQFMLTHPGGAAMVMAGDSYLGEALREMQRVLGYSDPLRLQRKFFGERYGLVFVVMRSIDAGGLDLRYRVEEGRIGDFQGFVRRTTGDASRGLSAYLFEGGDPVGMVQFQWRAGAGVLPAGLLDGVLGAVQRDGDRAATPARYFALAGAQTTPAAALPYLASAVCLAWDNPDYQLAFARAAAAVGNLKVAEAHLQSVVAAGVDRPDVKQLLMDLHARSARQAHPSGAAPARPAPP